MRTEHVAWSRKLFDALRDGGVWTVPRSGLVFTRRGDEFVLTQAMPWTEGMPLGRDELRHYQDADYRLIQRHFEAAGVPIRRETKTEENPA